MGRIKYVVTPILSRRRSRCGVGIGQQIKGSEISITTRCSLLLMSLINPLKWDHVVIYVPSNHPLLLGCLLLNLLYWWNKTEIHLVKKNCCFAGLLRLFLFRSFASLRSTRGVKNKYCCNGTESNREWRFLVGLPFRTRYKTELL